MHMIECDCGTPIELTDGEFVLWEACELDADREVCGDCLCEQARAANVEREEQDAADRVEQGVASVVAAIESEYGVRFRGYEFGSRYTLVDVETAGDWETVSIRVSDHEQPADGGYRHFPNGIEGRLGESDVSIVIVDGEPVPTIDEIREMIALAAGRIAGE